MIIEFTIDLMWVLHIGVSFTTAYIREVELITDIREIAKKYMWEGFVIDVLTTFSTLVTYYKVPELYYIKLLRLYYISRSQKIIKVQINSLETKLNISKQTIYKIDYFMSILVSVCVMMHSVSCFWLFIGEAEPKSWIRHPVYGLNAKYGVEEAEDGTLVTDR